MPVNELLDELLDKIINTVPLPFDVAYAQLNKLAYSLNRLIDTEDPTEDPIERSSLETTQNKSSELLIASFKFAINSLYLSTIEAKINRIIEDLDNNHPLKEMNALIAEYEALEQKKEEVKKNIDFTASYDEAITRCSKDPWIIARARQYLDEEQGNDISEFLLTASRLFLPTRYAKPYTDSRAESRFPSSDQVLKLKYLFAHKISISDRVDIIATSAPMKCSKPLNAEDDNGMNNDVVLNEFLELITSADAIVSIGGSSQRIPYRDHLPKQKKLFDLSAEDEQPLNLNDVDCLALQTWFQELSLEPSKTKKTVVIHCDSGVGRTGMIIGLMALQSAAMNDPIIASAITLIHQHIDEHETGHLSKEALLLIEPALTTLYTELYKKISDFRKIRYCIQQREQFKCIVPSLLLISAAANSELLEKIRICFNLPKLQADKTNLVDIPFIDSRSATAVDSKRSASERSASEPQSDRDAASPLCRHSLLNHEPDADAESQYPSSHSSFAH